MNFLWPEMLWSLLAIPLLVLLYVWLLRRRKKTSLRYASLSLVREALGARSVWRRHIPPTLLLVALAALLLATARPAAVITLPSQSQTVVLAMDCVGQHAGDRCAAKPIGRVSGSRQGVCRRASAQRARRGRRLRRLGRLSCRRRP
jgi:hypothetical protein